MAGTKSPHTIRMAEIQKLIDPSLKGLGFRKSQRTYNRQTEPGLVQVINFCMGRFELHSAGSLPIPARADLDRYGKFTVALGIYVEEVWKTLGLKSAKYISEPHCMIRQGLGPLIDREGKDCWWNLDDPAAVIAAQIKSYLLSAGLDFLNRFGSKSAIMAGYVPYNDRDGNGSPRSRLDIGVILAARGDITGAKRLFREHLSRPGIHPHHVVYVKELATNLGIVLED
jgi:hypothetical protein